MSVSTTSGSSPNGGAGRSTNGLLPFEILGEIFSHIRDDSTRGDVALMERLLLVCRAWTRAALGHPRLWAHISICICEKYPVNFWMAYSHSRLARMGSMQLIDVDIDCDDDPSEDSFDPVGFCYRPPAGLFSLISGERGQVARRWKTLGVESLQPMRGEPIDIFLSFPTPHLERIRLCSIELSPSVRPLPVTSALRSADFQLCGPAIPLVDTSQLLELALGLYLEQSLSLIHI